jgi:hypothetical protein
VSGIQAARVAADLRRTLGLEVVTVEGHYGEFSVHVDGVEVFNAGALAVLGVLPTRRKVRELVREHLGRRAGAASGTSAPEV